jgi:enoyl-[acyl-carrier protein] reductase II
MWKNRLTELLKTEYPLLQGGMAWVANSDLAAAVSNGGGVGIIAAGNMPPDLLEKEILKAREKTDRPFGLNIMLLSETSDDAIQLAKEHKVPIVTTGAGSPGKVIKELKPEGTIIIPVVASVALARRVARQGADAVIAEGSEAGGHIGEISTMVLVPQVADAIDIPVIAAGGIADGRGVLAALSLGAEGVQVGTRFVCCEESTVHQKYKDKILSAKDRSTVVTGQYTGHPVRCIGNRLTAELERLEKENVPIEDFEKAGSGSLRNAVVSGDVDWGSVMAGQSAALVNRTQPAEEIIREMFCEAGETFLSLNKKYHLDDRK